MASTKWTRAIRREAVAAGIAVVTAELVMQDGHANGGTGGEPTLEMCLLGRRERGRLPSLGVLAWSIARRLTLHRPPVQVELSHSPWLRASSKGRALFLAVYRVNPERNCYRRYELRL